MGNDLGALGVWLDKKCSTKTTDPFRNDLYNDFEPRDTDYKAWRADPKKHAGFWDHYYGRPRPFDVPDYRIYDSIEGIWQLEKVRYVLAQKGLKDPWIRNQVWRYPPDNNIADFNKGINILIGPKGKSLKWGIYIAAAVVILDHVRWHFQYGGPPPWNYEFTDWLVELYHSDKTKL